MTEAKLDPRFTQNMFIQYMVKDGSESQPYYYKSEVQKSKDGIVNFKYKRTHCIDNLDQSKLMFLTVSKVSSGSEM